MRLHKLTALGTVLLALSFIMAAAAQPVQAMPAHAHHHRHHHLHRRHHLRHRHQTGGRRVAHAAARTASTSGRVGATRKPGSGRPTSSGSGLTAAPSGSLPLAVTPVVVTGRTYYVSPSGSDSNSGISPDQAWRTVAQVNNANLQPGDGVMFQGGARFDDQTLMPPAGGTAGAPIVFSSYGNGQATITQGVWFTGENYLTFDNLTIGPAQGFQGGNDSNNVAHITIQHCTIDGGPQAASDGFLGINAYGSDWTITNNTVKNTGDSGLLLLGDHYTVTANTIRNTGLDRGLDYGKHGIYLKAANSTVYDNTITNFSTDGVSVRYRNSNVTNNTISGGAIGIAWFQYDTTAGTSHWTGNQITNTTNAGIYVSPSDQAGATIESFVITGNTIQTAGQAMKLKPTTGTYHVAEDQQL